MFGGRTSVRDANSSEGVMAELLSLEEAVARLVRDGDTVALEGFTHLIPVAAGQEIIRQGRRNLTLVRMTPDIVYDQLIGAGCARKLIFSWGGNPGVGSRHRFREAVTAGLRASLQVEHQTHPRIGSLYVAVAHVLPYAGQRRFHLTNPPLPH